MAKLRNNACLFELRDSAENLAHHFGSGRWVDEVRRSVNGDQLNAARLKQRMAGKLDSQVTSEAARILNEYDVDILIFAVRKQGAEARPRINRIATAHGSVVEAARDGKSTMGVSLNGVGLPMLAILIRPSVRGAARPIIGNRQRILPRHIVDPTAFYRNTCKLSEDCLQHCRLCLSGAKVRKRPQNLLHPSCIMLGNKRPESQHLLAVRRPAHPARLIGHPVAPVSGPADRAVDPARPTADLFEQAGALTGIA